MLLVAGVFIFSGIGAAAEFTADMIQTGPKVDYKGKLYVKGDKIRQEITKGRKQIVIERPDLKLVWSIYPEEKIYMKVTDAIIRGIDDPRARERFKQIGKEQPAGNQTINGYACTKRSWKLVDGKIRKTLTEWTSAKLGRILKIQLQEVASKWVIEYKNIKVEEVSDSVFELPTGYKLVVPPPAPAG